MPGATLEVSGIPEVISNLEALAIRFRHAAELALMDEAAAIQDVADANVPVASGDLLASHQIYPPQPDSADIQVTISYGDEATQAYAIAVHEHPSSADPPSWRNTKRGKVVFSTGGPKFLERAVRDAQSGMAERLAYGILDHGISENMG